MSFQVTPQKFILGTTAMEIMKLKWVAFYLSQQKAEAVTFDDFYWEWSEHYHKLRKSSPNTKSKYWTDYERFFAGKPFSKRRISEITNVEIEDFLLDCIESYVGNDGEAGLTYKAFGRLYGYLKSLFQRAFKLRLVDSNPMLYLEKSDFRSACKREKEKTPETELVSDEHFSLILKQLYQDMQDDPTYFPAYAVELAALTGMRVSELATLKWEDIDYEKGVIIISRSERNDRIVNKDGRKSYQWVVQETTKTKKKRKFPLDEDIIRSLHRIQEVQSQYGLTSEWVFPHEEYGWTHGNIISSCLKNKCVQLKLERTYGISAFRKTLNSDMRMDNAPSKLCASMLGNTVEVNDRHYYYDTSSMETKKDFVEMAHKKRAFA